MTEQIIHWIEGKPVGGAGDRRLPVDDPATGELAAEVAVASATDVDAAVAAARTAFPAWRDTSTARRTRVMFAFRDLVERHRGELAELVTRQHGKVLSDAAGEVQRGLEVVEFACGIGHLLKGERAQDVSTAVDAYSIRQPLGVAAGITPFNFPVMVPMWMFPIAVAAGNAFVLKPSEKDPGASVRLAELFAEAGLPDGVFNVVQGDKVAVDRLLAHPGVDAVSFVGSTPVARHVYETGTAAGKRVQALGGAKNHMVVLPDADVGQAADAAVSAGYGSAGERCMAISVVVAVVWGAVAVPNDAGDAWRQTDRAAIPLVSTLFGFNEADDYNATHPSEDDRTWGAKIQSMVAGAVESQNTSDDPTGHAAWVRSILAPDILRYRPGSDAKFADGERNGRDLTENSPEEMFRLVLNKPVPMELDATNATGVLRDQFPYLAQPVGVGTTA